MDVVSQRLVSALACLERVGGPDFAKALPHVEAVLAEHAAQLSPGSRAFLKRARDLLAASQETDDVDGLLEKVVRLIRGAAPPDLPASQPQSMEVPAAPASTVSMPEPVAVATAPVAAPPVVTAAAPAVELTRAVVSLTEADPDTLRDFVTEAREYVSSAEAALLKLETTPTDAGALGAVFRAFHTLKGVSAFLGMAPITELAHLAESMFGRMRDGLIVCKGEHSELAFACVDVLKDVVDVVSHSTQADHFVVPASLPPLMLRLEREQARAAAMDGTPVRVEASATPDLPVLTAPEVPAAKLEAVESQVADAPSAVTESQPRPETRVQPASDARVPESTIRVRTDRLDRLIDMVGELVIAQSMVSEGHASGSATSSQASKITRELYDLTLSLRMVPLRATFQKVLRAGRDVVRRLGRACEITVEGDDTEIDRNTVEMLADPLIHMIRNAIDHGVEGADERVAQGKSHQGKVILRAYRTGSEIVIELEDDGRGIDTARVLKKAVERGLVASDARLSDEAIRMLIFEPGFSTQEEVSEISGRGVGMDVVRQAVDSLKGRIGVHSVLGRGTTFSIRLPLTLAITEGMLVRVGAERYIIPIANIATNLRPESRDLCRIAQRGEFVRLRGELIPVVPLAQVFCVESNVFEPSQGLLVVLTSASTRFAVLVDELLGQQQVVAKSLGALSAARGIAGGAILGDGRVGLIIDPEGVFELAKSTGIACNPRSAEEQAA